MLGTFHACNFLRTFSARPGTIQVSNLGTIHACYVRGLQCARLGTIQPFLLGPSKPSLAAPSSAETSATTSSGGESSKLAAFCERVTTTFKKEGCLLIGSARLPFPGLYFQPDGKITIVDLLWLPAAQLHMMLDREAKSGPKRTALNNTLTVFQLTREVLANPAWWLSLSHWN